MIIRRLSTSFFSRCILSLRWIGLCRVESFFRRFEGLKVIILFVVVPIVFVVLSRSLSCLFYYLLRRILIFFGSFLNLLHVRCVVAACLDGWLLGERNQAELSLQSCFIFFAFLRSDRARLLGFNVHHYFGDFMFLLLMHGWMICMCLKFRFIFLVLCRRGKGAIILAICVVIELKNIFILINLVHDVATRRFFTALDY